MIGSIMRLPEEYMIFQPPLMRTVAEYSPEKIRGFPTGTKVARAGWKNF